MYRVRNRGSFGAAPILLLCGELEGLFYDRKLLIKLHVITCQLYGENGGIGDE